MPSLVDREAETAIMHTSGRLTAELGRVLITLLALAMIGVGLTAVTGPEARADEAPLPSPPPLLQRDENVVTSDPIPTVQIDNGYVWAQDTIGSTVYAVGDFDNAREPLAAPGTALTARSNVLAYDIESGALLPFAPQVNGVVKAVAASPDGSRIYIGGSFTSVNGQARWNIAALDAATGQLVPGFSPAIGGTGVYALVAEGSMVYAGGLFTQANGTARKNLAAFNAGNGAVMPWAPQTNLQIDAMVADPGGEKVIAGGRFSEVNGNTAMRGAVALDSMTGAVDPDWALVQTVKNGATTGKAGIFSLNTDDGAVYGTGWVYANASIGNLEGTFAAEADTGEVRWIADCLGDHYGVYSTGETVYTTSHTHACSTMGLHPEQSPREHRYAEAYTADVRGTLGRNPHAGGTYQNWEGTPAPSVYAWYPDFYVGTTSGLGQAGLSITGVGDTISIAGEFQGVNQGRFEGIVRFSTDPPGGAKDGPRLSASAWQPVANSLVPGRVRVSVPANWDRDDLNLTYELRRSGQSTPVATTTQASTWWNQPTVTLEDTTATPGATHSYTIVARDGDGNSRTSASVTATVAAGTASEYVQAVLEDSPQLYYPLGSTLEDWAGANPAQAGSGVTADVQGIPNSSTGSSDLRGTSAGRITSSQRTPAGDEFSTELWFRTTTGSGGKLIGYGDAASGSSGSYDRHVYMRNDGRLVFGVYPGEVRTVESTDSYDDGDWHHVVATLSGEGQRLYVDGELVGSTTSTTSAQAYLGYWRIGGDNLSGWPNRPSSDWFDGAIDEVAVYDRALTPAQISAHYAVGAELEAPTAVFDHTTDGAQVSVDGSGSSAAGGATLVEHRWDFGDGTPSETGTTAQHTYAATGTYTVTLTVKDSNGLLSSVSEEVDVLGPNVPPIADLTLTASGLTLSGDASASSDPDGTIVSYLWDWGDGATSTGATAEHTVAAAGEHTVTLTVTDDRGAVTETTRTVTTTHADPVAAFTVHSTGLQVTADAAASSAADGATLTYSWDWGDGSAATSGAVGTHVYEEEGVHEITLTVTDSLGSTASVAQSVTVTAEPLAASDTFSRVVPSGWGAADEGGTWAPVGGSAAVASVADGVGTLDLAAGSGRSVVLQGPSLVQSGTTFTYTLEGAPSNGALYVGSEAKYAGGNGYRTLVWHRGDGSAWLLIQRNGSIIATRAGTPAQWTSGSSFHLRSEVTGEAAPTIRMKVWPVGSAEPADWQLETTDTSSGALTSAGASALYVYRAGSGSGASAVAIDDYRLLDLSGPLPPAPNEAPAAEFSLGVAGLTVTADATGSSDPDGTIEAYAWDFGDGNTASGPTATHEYAEPGTYTVTLTVTDDEGATDSASTSQVVTAEVLAAGDAFERTASGGWGTADIGGDWSVTGGSTSTASVADGAGVLTLAAGSGRSMVLGDTELQSGDSSMTYTLTGSPQTGALYVGLESRFDGSSAYRSTAWHRADGTVWLLVQRRGAVIGVMPLAGSSWSAGDRFHLRTEISGSDGTTVRVKLWAEGSTEPSGWQLETTDAPAAALTAAGSPGVYVYRAGSGSGQAPVHVDDLRVQDSADAPAAARAVVEEEPAVAEEPSVKKAPATAADKAPAPASEKAPASDSEAADLKDPAPETEEAPAAEPVPDAEKQTEADPAPESDTVPETTGETEPGTEAEPGGAAGDENGDGPEQEAAPEGAAEEPAPEQDAAEPDASEQEPAEQDEPTAWISGPDGEGWSFQGVDPSAVRSEDGTGTITVEPGEDAVALHSADAPSDVELETSFRLDSADSSAEGTAIGVVARATDQGGYLVLADVGPEGAVTLRAFSGTEEIHAVELPDLHLQPGEDYVLQVSATGTASTEISAKLWRSGDEAPEDWQLETTDDSGDRPVSGEVGLAVHREAKGEGTLEVRFDRFEVSPSA